MQKEEGKRGKHRWRCYTILEFFFEMPVWIREMAQPTDSKSVILCTFDSGHGYQFMKENHHATMIHRPTTTEYYETYVKENGHVLPDYNLDGYYVDLNGLVCQCKQCSTNFYVENGSGH